MPSKYAGWRSPCYLAAYDTTTQTVSAANERFIWKINTVDLSKGISIADSTKITFAKDGVYNIQFSAQVVEQNASATDLWIWPVLNGVNIPNSNTKYTLQGAGQAAVITLNYVLNLRKDDFVQIAWANSTTTSLLAELSSTSPNKPAIPSIILTVWQIN